MTALRAGLLILLTFSVLAHGVTETWSEVAMISGAALLFLLWGSRSGGRRKVEVTGSPLYWPLLALGILFLAQGWLGLSLAPEQAREEFLKSAALFLVFFLTVQAFRTTLHLHSFLWYVVVLGFLVSVVGLLQFFSAPQKLYWFREIPPNAIPFGPYVNRNHFAGLMELILPLGLAALTLRGVATEKLQLLGVMTVVSLGAVFVSGSRGGIVALLCQAVLLAWLARRQLKRKWLLTAATLVVAATAFVVWLGGEKVFDRFAQFHTEEVSNARRVAMLRDSWKIFLDFPIAGSGRGTLASVYPRYESYYDGRIVDHAHNDYVEFLAETGILGASVLLLFLFLLFRSALSRLRASHDPLLAAMRIGALTGCFGLLVHGIVDFNFQIPANTMLFLMLAALATGDYEISDPVNYSPRVRDIGQPF